jgi:hypothetical protein
LEEERMSRRETMNERIENAGIAQALAELIEKNQVLTIELESLAQLVDVETAAAQERDAEQTARLGEALGELADAKAAVEIERQKRIKAEEIASGLAAALDVIKAAVARLPSAIPGTVRDGANDAQVVAAVTGEATLAAVLPPRRRRTAGRPTTMRRRTGSPALLWRTPSRRPCPSWSISARPRRRRSRHSLRGTSTAAVSTR